MRRHLWLTAIGMTLLTSGVPATRAAAAAKPAKRIAVLAGGSGEDSADNFFVKDLRAYRKTLIDRGWQVNAAVGSRAGLLPSSRPARNADILSAVRSALERAGSGDEVLVVLHGHGYAQESTWGQRSHSLVTEDVDSAGTELGFDIDVLDPLFVRAGKRGVRVAFVDLSCYSGTSQSLKGPSCTMTLAAPHYISLCSGRPEEHHFSAHFFELPKKGTAVTLEDQYLSARRADRDSVNLPQISSRPTPALAGWDAFLRGVDPLDSYEDIENLRSGVRPFDASVLMAEIDRAIAALPAELQADAKTGALRRRISDKLSKILELRSDIEDELPEMAHAYDDPSVTLKLDGSGELLTLAPATLAEALQRLHESKPKLDGYTQARRDLIEKLRPERDKLTSEFLNPIAEFRQSRQSLDAATDQIAEATGELFDLEREFYLLTPAPALGADPGACRAFTL